MKRPPKDPRFHITDDEVVEPCRKDLRRGCPYGGSEEHFQCRLDALAHLAYRTHDPVKQYWLAHARDMEVRRAVAANEHVSKIILHELVHDDAEWVQRHLAENPNTSPITLDMMAQDPEVCIRAKENIALNLATAVLTLGRLVSHHDWDVRHNVASNPNTPYELLKVLASDNRIIREAVFVNASRLPFEERTWIDIEIALKEEEENWQALDDEESFS